jgi:hypothetical protein
LFWLFFNIGVQDLNLHVFSKKHDKKPFGKHRPLEQAITILIVGTGLLFRLRQFFFARSLWLDEAALANNFLIHGIRFLLTNPLDDKQSAPIGFILLTKLFGWVFHYTDQSLRFLPLLFGIGSIFLALGISSRFSKPLTRFTYLSLISFSPVLIYYSNEVKPYISDVFFFLLITLVWFSYSRWKYGQLILYLVGGIGLFFSNTFPFVLFIIGIFEIISSNRRKDYRKRNQIFIISLGWSLLFFILFWGYILPTTMIDYYVNYWSTRFPPTGFSLETFIWFQKMLQEMFYMGFIMYPPIGLSINTGTLTHYLVLIIGLVGFILQLNRDNIWALFNLAIFILFIFLAVIRIYPFGSRLSLFLIPLSFSMICYNFECKCQSRKSLIELLQKVLSVIVVALVLYPSIRFFITPADNSNIKGALSYLETRGSSTDSLIISNWSNHSYNFYQKQYELPEFKFISYFSPLESQEKFIGKICRTEISNRVWILNTHRYLQTRLFISQIIEMGDVLEEWESSDSGLFYVEFDKDMLCK